MAVRVAMDHSTFRSLKSQLQEPGPFFFDKMAVLKSFLQSNWFSGEQAAKVIDKFVHASEKEEVLALIAPRLTTLTGADGKKIVSAFTYAGGKLKAVELIANHIKDTVGKYTVLEAITYSFDKEKARKILDEARPPAVSQPCHQPSTHHHHHHRPESCPPSQPPPGQGYHYRHHHSESGCPPSQPPPGQGYHYRHHHSESGCPPSPPPPGQGYSISVNLPSMQFPGFPLFSFGATTQGDSTVYPPPQGVPGYAPPQGAPGFPPPQWYP